MNQVTSPIRWTIHDLNALPENEGIRREIINGELFVTRAPHWKHQNLINKIGRKLEEWSENHFGFVIPNPGIVPSSEDSVIPDLVWVTNERLTAIEDDAGHLTGFPELVVEVLSAGERNIYRDQQAKLKLYSQGGVKEYWIVDRFTKQLEVYHQKNGLIPTRSRLYLRSLFLFHLFSRLIIDMTYINVCYTLRKCSSFLGISCYTISKKLGCSLSPQTPL